jgi:pyruvate dehydrogenase E2 component (dihydrolipoamide acetyltransferase)
VQEFVKQAMTASASGAAGGVRSGGSLNLLPWPTVDFAKFGRSRTAAVAHQEDLRREPRANWVMIPARHAVRRGRHHRSSRRSAVALNKENEKAGVKVTMLAFLIKASVAALRKFPDVNASLISTPTATVSC